MKKSFYSLFIAAIVSLTAVCAHAAETASEAVVLKISGSPSAVLPGQTQPVALKVGDRLPQGTVINTAGASEVEVQVFSGTTAKIKPGSSVNISKLSLTTANGAVTKQSALLDLKLGSVVSSLDPSQKAINDYSIRTPKGVAAARGTVFEVSVSATGVVRTFVTNGVVTFNNPATGQTVTVQPGYAVTVDAAGNIGEPAPATSAQIQQAGETPNTPIIDVTIPAAINDPVVSPSS